MLFVYLSVQSTCGTDDLACPITRQGSGWWGDVNELDLPIQEEVCNYDSG